MSIKQWYKSRTIHIAIAQSILGLLLVFTAEFPELQAAGWLALVKSALDVFIRVRTNEAVGKSASPGVEPNPQ